MTNNQPAAGFFLRFLAYFNEKLIFLLLASLYLWNVSKNSTLNNVYQGIVILLVIIVFYFLLGMVYTVLFTHYFGGDIGKLLGGLRVRDLSGNKLTFNKVLFRQLLSYKFSWLVFGLGFLSILKDPNKQAWHDKTVDSNVFKVQPLLPLALLVFLLTLGGSGYFLKSSFDNFLNSPVKQEVLGLVAAFQEQSKNNQKTSDQKISKQIQDQQLQVYDLMKANKIDEALKEAQLMLINSKTTSEKSISTQVIGEVYASKLDHPTAKTYFTDALKLDQNLPGAYIGLAAANIREKDFQQAIANAQKAIDLAPSRSDYYYLLGLAYYGAKDKDKAIQNIEKAIQGNPNVEEYKKTLEDIKNSTSQTTTNQTQTKTTAPAQPTGPGYTQADIKSWQDELSYINQDLSNIPKFLGNSSYDQGKLNQMSTLLDQRKAIANQIYTKMVNNQTLTTQDEQAMNTYDQLTSQYASLANQVFPRQ
ncbi:MAG: RDD family protein [Patescibacteria group bacterium]|nr:RDD family protein [Patescibacteria group bacterium]